MGHSQPYHPGPQHWAGLIVDALEVLLTDSCLCLESVPLASTLPLPLSQIWLGWSLLHAPPCCQSSLVTLCIQTPPCRE